MRSDLLARSRRSQLCPGAHRPNLPKPSFRNCSRCSGSAGTAGDGSAARRPIHPQALRPLAGGAGNGHAPAGVRAGSPFQAQGVPRDPDPPARRTENLVAELLLQVTFEVTFSTPEPTPQERQECIGDVDRPADPGRRGDAIGYDPLASGGRCSPASVADVQGIPQRPIQRSTTHLIQPADRRWIQDRLRDREQVVAADHTDLGQALLGAHLHLRANPPDRPGYRRTRHRLEHRDRRVPGQHAYRPPTSRWPEVGPVQLPARYHPGAFSAASRAATVTIAGSCGVRR
jgi:hypothetical protein